VALATARAGNVIGGGDWSEDRLIPDLIRGFQSRKPVVIRNPKAVRPWQHVLEPLQGYILLAEKLLSGDPRVACAFNFGPGDEGAWPVEQIADRMVDLWGEGANWVRGTDSGVHEAGMLRLDASKARAELGWKPRLGIEEALDWTIRWYRAWNDGAEMGGETLRQIADYEAAEGSGGGVSGA
jgi:CDP-glucose 4,6-dehydratase